jgi:hypothetical protein
MMRIKASCLIWSNPQLDNLYVAKGYEIVACNCCGFCQVAQQPSVDELESLKANLHVSHTKFRDEQARPARETELAFMIPPLHLGNFSRRSFDYLFSRQIPGSILNFFRSQGKWTRLALLSYKINQISRWLAPPSLLDRLSRSRFGRINIYIPTSDIIYLVLKKPN